MGKYHYKKHYSRRYRYKPRGGKTNTLSNLQYRAIIKKLKFALLVGIGTIIATLLLLRSCNRRTNYPVKLPEVLPKSSERWI